MNSRLHGLLYSITRIVKPVFIYGLILLTYKPLHNTKFNDRNQTTYIKAVNI